MTMENKQLKILRTKLCKCYVLLISIKLSSLHKE